MRNRIFNQRWLIILLLFGLFYATQNTQAAYITSGGSQWLNNASSIYYNLGNVGIGTTAPGELFEVKGGRFQVSNGVHGLRMGYDIYGDDLGIFDLNDKYISGIYNSNYGYGGEPYQPFIFINGTNGNVGIGTTTPASRLSISGGNALINDAAITSGTPKAAVTKEYLDSSLSAYTPGGAGWSFDGNTVGQVKSFGTLDNYAIPFLTNGVERMRLTEGGNFVLGATSTGVRLHVESPQGAVAFFKSKLNGGSYAGYIGNGQTFTGEEFGLYYALNDERMASYNLTNSLLMYGGHLSSDAALVINSAGNVGIGTTNPWVKFNVRGSDIVASFNVTNNSRGGLYIGNAGMFSNDEAGLYDMGADQPLVVYDAQNNLVRLGSSIVDTANYGGNVGIGTTTPTSKLAVSGGNIFINDAAITSGTPKAAVTKEYLDSSLSAFGATNNAWILSGSNLYASSTAWNVGIGTTNALEKLDLRDGNLYISDSDLASNGTGGAIKFGRPDGYASNWLASIGSYATTGYDRLGLTFNTSFGTSQERMRITPEGNVGIGTTNPSQKLEIIGGNVRITNAVLGNGVAPLVVQNTNAYANPWTQYSQVWLDSAGSVMAWMRNDGTFNMGGTQGMMQPRKIQLTSSGTAVAPAFINSESINSGIFFPNSGAGIGFSNAGVESMRIDSSGNVGIGTTTPASRLSISGGNALINDAAITSGTPKAAVTKEYLDSSLSAFASTNNTWILNGSNLYASSTSWNVGIGTTNPQARFQVQRNDGQRIARFGDGGQNVHLDIIPEASNVLTLQSKYSLNLATNDASTSRLFINTTGNVGIGTTTPDTTLTVNNSGYRQQVIKNSISSQRLWFGSVADSIGTFIGSNAYYSNSYAFIPNYDAASGINFRQDGSTEFWNDAGLTSGTSYVPTKRMVILNSGNVGIGTNSPSESRLQINSSEIATGWNDANLKILFNGAETVDRGGSVAFGGSVYHAYGRISGRKESAVNSNAGYLRFDTRSDAGTAEKMRITSTGNVGIGTTTPAATLSISGGNAFINDAAITSGTPKAAVTKEYLDSAIAAIVIPPASENYWTLNGSNLYSSSTTWNVGVGMTDPLSRLNIVQSGTGFQAALRIENKTGVVNDATGIIFSTEAAAGGGKGGIAYSRTASWARGDLMFLQNNIANGSIADLSNAVMTIKNTGYVGIGTTTPSQQLQITGNFVLPTTKGTTPYGIIYKNNDIFIHDFTYGLNSNSITPAGANTFVGNRSGNLTMGSTATYSFHSSYNTAVGSNSLSSNTTGFQNAALGNRALSSNTTGGSNSGFGNYALTTNTTGDGNSGFGNYALYANSSGMSNAAFGGDTLRSNTYGSYNSALGANALYHSISGRYNVAVGFNAGRYLANGTTGRTTGDYGIYLGYNTKASADGTENEIVIGYNVTGNGSSTATYGNTSMLRHIFSSGNVGIGTTNITSKLSVSGGNIFINDASITSGTPKAAVTKEYLDSAIAAIVIPPASENYWTLSGSNLSASSTAWNLGVGTTTPGAKLHVVGNAIISTGLTMGGSINLGGNNITNINKLTVGTIDPLYNIKGVNYSTFASAIVGGVKEEYVGRIKISRRLGDEYEARIDFSSLKEGSDLWVWRKVVDFNADNIEASITPYGSFANVYYLIDGEKLIFRSDRPAEISYRLVGKRHDWRKWPTRAEDQAEEASFIID